MNTPLGFVLCIALAVEAVGATGWAQPTPSTTLEARYQQGADLRERQQDAEALQVFQALYTETRQPRALAQMGLAAGALGRWLEAEQHLVAALAANDPWIVARRTQLEGALATMRTHLGHLEVACAAPGATVWVEGRELGAVGAPLRVLAGTVSFEVRAGGHVGVTRVATVPSGGRAREAVTLVPLQGAPTTAAAPSGDAGTGVAAPPSRADTGGGGRSTAAVAALVGGGLLLVGGVAVWAYGWSQVGDYNADPACPPPEQGGLPAQCQSRLDTAGWAEPVGWVGMLSGAALGAVGGVLLGMAPRAARERNVALTTGPGALGAGLRLRF